MRARELGIEIGAGEPGPLDAITDVADVLVGHETLIEGDGPLVVGAGPIRTGVTIVRPHAGLLAEEPLFAGYHSLNGNGEVTGLQWLKESGQLMSPIGLTNSHSVGVVRDTLAAIECERRTPGHLFWSLPVAGETWDGVLNDINGFHVKQEHVRRAYAAAKGGAVAEGNVGGGTGMICYMFKGGIGTSSRVLPKECGGYTVGVLVQANFGRRCDYIVNGAPVGQHLGADVIPSPEPPESSAGELDACCAPRGEGSIVGIAATNAPLLPHQCTRLAQRLGLGVARTGDSGDHWSGDIFIAFSTANRGQPAGNLTWPAPLTYTAETLTNNHIDPLFDAAVAATQEAILNAQLAAETMIGRDSVTAHAIDPERLVAILQKYDRLRYAVATLGSH